MLEHPEYIDGSVAPDRDDRNPFTILLHEQPDLDCVASALFSQVYLAAGRFPENEEIARRLEAGPVAAR